MQNFIINQEKFHINQLITTAITITSILLCVISIACPESAFAAQTTDTLHAHTEKIEGILTGNLMRIAVLTGTIWGAVQSYMAGKFIILVSTLGIGLGTYGILGWVKDTWAFVI